MDSNHSFHLPSVLPGLYFLLDKVPCEDCIALLCATTSMDVQNKGNAKVVLLLS